MWDTLLGGLPVIAGGVLTFAGNYWMETRRWKREDKYRNYADRQRVYSEFLARSEWYERAIDTLYIGEDRTEVEEARWKLMRSYNALSLLAPEEVCAAAHDLREWSERNPADRDPAVPGRYWKAARTDLGIPD